MIRQFNRDTPIVAVTSNTKPSHVMNYYTAGMNDVLSKPVERAEVIELLEVRCTTILASSLGVDWPFQQKHLAHLMSKSTRTSSQNSIQYSTMDKSSVLSSTLPLKRPWEETAATVGNAVLEKRGRY